MRPNNIFFQRLAVPQVAIKRIGGETAYKDCYHAKQVYREIALLKQLQHDNIIKLVDLFASPLGMALSRRLFWLARGPRRGVPRHPIPVFHLGVRPRATPFMLTCAIPT